MARQTTLRELAALVDGRITGPSDVRLTGLNGLEYAGPTEITFVVDERGLSRLADSRAGACIVPESAPPGDRPFLHAADPNVAAARIHAFFLERPFRAEGVHPTAVIGRGCRVPEEVSIGPHCVRGDGVTLGPRVRLGAGVVLGEGVRVGADTVLHARVTVYDGCRIGERVVIHSGAVIGADGFGFATTAQGVHVKRPQVGIVVIEDDVEIGANTCIDRAAQDVTLIGDGVKLDNLIHIAHNVRVGDNTAMAAGCGIAGSTRIGRRCTFAGQVGVADNLEICDDAHFTGRAVVLKSVTRPGVYSSGILLDETGKWRRNALRFNQLDALFRQVRGLLKGADNKPG